MSDAAQALHERTGLTAGNGALMRTAIVGLSALGELERTAAAARAVASLTHADPLAGDSCVLWTAGVATAVLEGSFDGVRRGLDLLPAERRDRWAGWLDEAEASPPAQSRTPTVAARYAVLRGSTVEQAQAMVLRALPDASPNPTLWKAMAALGEGSARDLFEPTATDPRP